MQKLFFSGKAAARRIRQIAFKAWIEEEEKDWIVILLLLFYYSSLPSFPPEKERPIPPPRLPPTQKLYISGGLAKRGSFFK